MERRGLCHLRGDGGTDTRQAEAEEEQTRNKGSMPGTGHTRTSSSHPHPQPSHVSPCPLLLTPRLPGLTSLLLARRHPTLFLAITVHYFHKAFFLAAPMTLRSSLARDRTPGPSFNKSHSSDNFRSLTRCATRELLHKVFLSLVCPCGELLFLEGRGQETTLLRASKAYEQLLLEHSQSPVYISC